MTSNNQPITTDNRRNAAPDDAWAEEISVAAILREWGAAPALQAAGEWCTTAAGLTGLDAGRLEAEAPETLTLCQRYRRFCLTSPLPPEEMDIPVPQPAHNRRGAPLALQRIHAYCAAYDAPDAAFLYAAVLWQRFLRARDAREPHRRAYQDEARLLLSPFLEMLGMRELSGEVDWWLAEQAPDDPDPAPRLTNAQIARMVEPIQRQLPTAEFKQGRYTQIHTADAGSGATPPIVIDVLVPRLPDCYTALYHIHDTYTIIDGGLADHLRGGRANSYRCLTCMVWSELPDEAGPIDTAENGGGRKPGERARVQFRIATHALYEVNSWGLAAYYLRRRLEGELPPGWWTQREAGSRHIALDKPGALPGTLYVFSPHGQLFKFNQGATVVDYAYHVHSDLADRCRRFVVNGETAEPFTVLRHLDLVELEHDVHAPGPTQVWLNAARTSRARAKIQRFLKRRGYGVYQGRRILEEQLEQLADYYGFAMPKHRVDQVVRRSLALFELSGEEEFYNEIANGRLDPRSVLIRYFSEEVAQQIELPPGVSRRNNLRIAQCCRPRPGDPIVGWAKRRGTAILELRVHRADCERMSDMAEDSPDRLALSWRPGSKLAVLAQLEIIAQNDDGLLGDAIGQVYAALPHVNLHRADALARRGVAVINFIVEAESHDVLEQMAQSLRDLPYRNVDHVRIMDVPPTEREDLANVSSLAFTNPYSRMPVHEREMFFGRKAELERIAGDLQANAEAIWLRGQKRVGKTSLLLQLKRIHLHSQGFVPAYVDFQMLSQIDGPLIFYDLAAHIYSDLQHSDLRLGEHHVAARIDELGPPLRDLFEHEPARQFMQYLMDIQHCLGQNHLLLLLDEFSRTIDAKKAGRLPIDFFDQWRGIMLNTPRINVNMVLVVQQRTYERLKGEESFEQEPIAELLELGDHLILRPLDHADVQRLIEWPIQNVLEYPPTLVGYVASLTGGSPFLIQAFCHKLVTGMRRRHAHRVTRNDVEAVCREFMHPGESLFAHLLDLVRGVGLVTAQRLADLAEESGQDEIAMTQLSESMPQITREQLQRTLEELSRHDILIAEPEERWRFASLLFRRWLHTNPRV
ncbi:MAG: TGS domain-containing protein [Caldilineaceae bacterium]|nr:TGS domain-containing protein [Caldilineaceae bacterium]